MAAVGSPKHVLITGASRGIGLHAAVELAKRGHRVFAGVRDSGRCPALDQATSSARVSIEKVQLDVTEPESVASAVADVIAATGRLDVLVNNAGIIHTGFFETLAPHEFEAVLRTNFYGAVSVTRAVLPHMRTRRQGVIINVSSLYGLMGAVVASPYAASKWALEGFSESLRHEMAPFGVHVAIVQPGFVATDMTQETDFQTEWRYGADSPYRDAAAGVYALFSKHILPRSGDAVRVGQLIAKVAESGRPRLRYPIGVDTSAVKWLRRLLPSSLVDRALATVLSTAMGSQRAKL